MLANPNPFAVVVLANLYVLQTQKNDEQRLLLKQKIYEIAHQRGYSRDKVEKLLLFLFELMQLPEDLESQFNEVFINQKKSSNMPYITQTSRNTIDAMAKGAFGQSVSELKTAIKAQEKELKNNEKALKNNEKVLKNSEKVLYTRHFPQCFSKILFIENCPKKACFEEFSKV